MSALKVTFIEENGAAKTVEAQTGQSLMEAAKANGGKVPTRADVLKYVQATKNLATPIGAMGFDKNGDTTNGALSFYKIVNLKPQFTNQITLKT